jgi:hypothetical protein
MAFRARWGGFLLDHEEQKNRYEQSENAQSFGERDADEDASELSIGSGGIAQGAQKKLTENYTDADRGGARADRGETCAYKPSCCGIHFILRDFDERATDLLFKYLFSGPDELRR